tara:strand:- start:1338 stop:2177 length:840 start_codon:yes stop_codon:yes gene_type:complete
MTATWGECLQYTTKVRWRHLRSAKTNAINANHITNAVGKSAPMKTLSKASFWMEFIADMKDEGRNTSTINRIISAGRTVFETSLEAELHNFAWPKVKREKEGEARLTFFTKEDVQKMAYIATTIFERPDLADAIVFSAYTGVRQGELLKLKVEDYDPAHDLIWIGGKPGRETKGNNVRSVFLHDLVKPIIQNRLDRTYLFRDDWTNKDQLYSRFKKVRAYAGLPEDHVWHSLRHSFGTWLGEVCHPKQIQTLMGHANIETTLRYVKPTEDALRSAIVAI